MNLTYDGLADSETGGGEAVGGGSSMLPALLASAAVACSLFAAVAVLSAFNAKKRRLRHRCFLETLGSLFSSLLTKLTRV